MMRLGCLSLLFALAIGGSSAAREPRSTQCETPDGMVARWSFDGDALDSAGSNHGTLVGGATLVSGLVGGALKLDGTGYVLVPDAAALNPTQAITIEAWIQVPRARANFPPIVKKNFPTDAQGYALELAGVHPDPPGVAFHMFPADNAWSSGTAPIPFAVNAWTHVAGTFDGAFVRVYVNGELRDARPARGTGLPSPGPLNIGRDPVRHDRTFEGLIDELSIWNVALRESAIAAIFGNGAGGKCGLDLQPSLEAMGTTAPWGGRAQLTAAVAVAGAAAGHSVDFAVDGAFKGTAVTDGTGTAVLDTPIEGLEIGTYRVDVNFTSPQAETLSASGTLTVVRAQSVITWEPPDLDVGGYDPSETMNATASVPGTFDYQPLPNDLPIGTYDIRATFTPDDQVHYEPVIAMAFVSVLDRSDISAPRFAGLLEHRGHHLAYDSQERLLFGSNRWDRAIHVFDTTTRTTVRSLQLQMGGSSSEPAGLAFDPATRLLYVADGELPVIWAVDPSGQRPAVVIQLPVAPGYNQFHSVVFSSSLRRLYAPRMSVDGRLMLLEIDPANPATEHMVSIPVTVGECQPGAENVVVDDVAKVVYVGTGHCSQIKAIDVDPSRPATRYSVVGDLPLPGTVAHPSFGGASHYRTEMAVSRRTKKLYVAGTNDGGELNAWIQAYDADPLSPTFAQPAELREVPVVNHGVSVPMAVAINSDTNLLYVVYGDTNLNSNGAVIAALDLQNHVVASLREYQWTGEASIAIDAHSNRLYVGGDQQAVTIYQESQERNVETLPSAIPVSVGSNQVTVEFSAVIGAGVTTIDRIDAASVNAALPGQYELGAQAFEISTTASYVAPLTLCFNVSSVTDPAEFAALRVLHGENGALVDRTSSSDYATGTICATVDSLSPFVVARKKAPSYALRLLYDPSRGVKSGSTMPIRLQVLDASGANVSSPELTVSIVGAANDAGRANAGGAFRYDMQLGGYIFNLSTRGLAPGTHTLRITAGDDPRMQHVEFTVAR